MAGAEEREPRGQRGVHVHSRQHAEADTRRGQHQAGPEHHNHRRDPRAGPEPRGARGHRAQGGGGGGGGAARHPLLCHRASG